MSRDFDFDEPDPDVYFEISRPASRRAAIFGRGGASHKLWLSVFFCSEIFREH